MSLVEARHLTKEFPVHRGLLRRRVGAVRAVDRVDLRLEKGECLALVGESGSGKTTLARCLVRLIEPSSGEILYGGLSPWSFSEPELARFRNRHIGFVFQDAHLLPQYDVLENVLLPSLAFDDDAAEDAEPRARSLLDRVGLGHRLEHRPAELSGGERQRVAVARALINRPGLLLCDEPTGSLDTATAGEIGDLLVEIQNEQRLQLLVVTHSHELAERFERCMELRDGRCYEV